MPWRLTNTALDPTRAMQRRQAARLSTDPLVCGRILRIRDSFVVTDEEYARDKVRIDLCVKQGVIKAEQIGKSPSEKTKAVPKVEAPPAPVEEPKDEPVVEAPPVEESFAAPMPEAPIAPPKKPGKKPKSSKKGKR